LTTTRSPRGRSDAFFAMVDLLLGSGLFTSCEFPKRAPFVRLG
jgi:hypothetical protein